MLRIIIALPLLILIVVFALSNPQHVTIGMWPTDDVVQAPLSLALLVAMGAAFLLGALLIWVGALGVRHRARRAERQVRMLEAQVATLKAELVAATAPPAPRAGLDTLPGAPALAAPDA